MSKEWDKRDNDFMKGLGAEEGCPRSVVMQTRHLYYNLTTHSSIYRTYHICQQRTCCELAVHNMYSAYRKIFQKGILKSVNTSSVHKLMMCMRISKHIV
jgi:hypothetical protein